MKEIKISIFGVGKLGASRLAGFASRGFNVVGTDINQAAVDAVNRHEAPVQETGLAEMIRENREHIRATSSPDEALADSDISFVIVPTPSDRRGAFSIEYAKHAFSDIGKALTRMDDVFMPTIHGVR